MDNIKLHETISSIDFAHAMSYAAKTNLFDIHEGGETASEISRRAGLPLHKVDSLIRAGLHLNLLARKEEKIVTGENDWADMLPQIVALVERAHLLQFAIREDLFEIPDEGEMMPQILQRTGISPLQILALIETGADLELLRLDKDEKVYLTKTGKLYVTKSSPCSMRELIAGLPLDYAQFEAGFVAGRLPPMFSNDPRMVHGMVGAMHQKSVGLASHWPSQVDLSDTKTFLDVGAGSGIHAIEACQHNAQMHGIALDLPHVCPVTKQFIQRYGMSERVQALACDMFAQDLPKANVIFMCDVVHDWSDAKVTALLQKAHEALPPGGQLILAEVLLNEDGTGPFAAVAFDISVLKMIPNEECGQRTGKQIEAMLTQAGFEQVRTTPTYSGYTIIESTKS